MSPYRAVSIGVPTPVPWLWICRCRHKGLVVAAQTERGIGVRRASAPWCQDARTCRYGRRAHAQMALLCAAWAASRHAETAAHCGGSARCSWARIPSRIVTVSMSMTSSSWSSRLPFLTICASYVGLIFQLTDGFAGRGRAQPPAWLPLAQTAVACQLVALLALTCPDRRRHG